MNNIVNNKEKSIKNIKVFLKIAFLFCVLLLWAINITIAITTYKTNYLLSSANPYSQQFKLLFIISFVFLSIIGISYLSFAIYSIKIKTFRILLLTLHFPFVFIFLLILASELFLFSDKFISQVSLIHSNAYLSFFIIFICFNFIFLLYIPLLVKNLNDYTFFNLYNLSSSLKFNKVDLSKTWLNFYYQVFILIFILKMNSKNKEFYQVALYKNINILNSFRTQRNIINAILNAIIFVLPIIVSSVVPFVSNYKIDSSTQIIFGVTLGTAISGLVSFLTWVLNHNKKTYNISNFNNLYFKSLKDSEVYYDSNSTKTNLLLEDEKVNLELFNFYSMKKYDKTIFIHSLLVFCEFKNYNNDWVLLDEHKILEKFFLEEFSYFNSSDDNIMFPYKVHSQHVDFVIHLTKNDFLFLINSIKDYKEK
ncbi:MAG: hypothetical protein RSD51_02855 [Malacoplasma sp.]